MVLGWIIAAVVIIGLGSSLAGDSPLDELRRANEVNMR
jgi:hypothetical protein